MSEYKQDWKPVEKGAVYCSPSCGGKCKKSAFQEATRKANELAQLMGDGWKPNVWENLGWFYSVSKGVVDIHPGSISGYTVFFNTNPQIVRKGEDPRETLNWVVAEARAISRKILEDCENV